MIISKTTATRLKDLYFEVLFAGVLAPELKDYESNNVYFDKLLVFNHVRKQRVEKTLGYPLYVDIDDEMLEELKRVPVKKGSYNDTYSVLICGMRLSPTWGTFCLFTTWETCQGKLALVLEKQKSEDISHIETQHFELESNEVGYIFSKSSAIV